MSIRTNFSNSTVEVKGTSNSDTSIMGLEALSKESLYSRVYELQNKFPDLVRYSAHILNFIGDKFSETDFTNWLDAFNDSDRQLGMSKSEFIAVWNWESSNADFRRETPELFKQNMLFKAAFEKLVKYHIGYPIETSCEDLVAKVNSSFIAFKKALQLEVIRQERIERLTKPLTLVIEDKTLPEQLANTMAVCTPEATDCLPESIRAPIDTSFIIANREINNNADASSEEKANIRQLQVISLLASKYAQYSHDDDRAREFQYLMDEIIAAGNAYKNKTASGSQQTTGETDGGDWYKELSGASLVEWKQMMSPDDEANEWDTGAGESINSGKTDFEGMGIDQSIGLLNKLITRMVNKVENLRQSCEIQQADAYETEIARLGKIYEKMLLQVVSFNVDQETFKKLTDKFDRLVAQEINKEVGELHGDSASHHPVLNHKKIFFEYLTDRKISEFKDLFVSRLGATHANDHQSSFDRVRGQWHLETLMKRLDASGSTPQLDAAMDQGRKHTGILKGLITAQKFPAEQDMVETYLGFRTVLLHIRRKWKDLKKNYEIVIRDDKFSLQLKQGREGRASPTAANLFCRKLNRLYSINQEAFSQYYWFEAF